MSMYGLAATSLCAETWPRATPFRRDFNLSLSSRISESLVLWDRFNDLHYGALVMISHNGTNKYCDCRNSDGEHKIITLNFSDIYWV